MLYTTKNSFGSWLMSTVPYFAVSSVHANDMYLGGNWGKLHSSRKVQCLSPSFTTTITKAIMLENEHKNVQNSIT